MKNFTLKNLLYEGEKRERKKESKFLIIIIIITQHICFSFVPATESQGRPAQHVPNMFTVGATGETGRSLFVSNISLSSFFFYS